MTSQPGKQRAGELSLENGPGEARGRPDGAQAEARQQEGVSRETERPHGITREPFPAIDERSNPARVAARITPEGLSGLFDGSLE